MVRGQASLRRAVVRSARVAILLAAALLVSKCPAEETPPKPAELVRLIDKVRANEALFANLDATVKISRTYYPNPGAQGLRAKSFGSSVLQATDETDRVSMRGSRYFFSGEELVSFSSGETITQRRLATFDGTRSVAIEADNAATVYHGRYEPSEIRPPLCWGIFTLEVNFPLSVFLQGTAAIKSHSKAPKFPSERGSVFEFSKVEVEPAGEEKVDDLACVKVKVRRWYYTSEPPSIQYLWLAKDRNYHVARCQTARLKKGKEEPDFETRVTKWQKIAEGVWLPAVVTSETFWPNRDGTKSKNLCITRRLALEKATIASAIPAEGFKLPRIPDALPKFVIGTDGRLEDSPQHLAPARADSGTTLDSILKRLAAEEAKYDRLDIATTERYQQLNLTDGLSASAGSHISTQTAERSVVAGNHLFFSVENKTRLASGDLSSLSTRQGYDGRWIRQYGRLVPGSSDRKVQQWASLSLGGADEMQLVRAHTTVFRGDRNRQSLSAFLRSGWYDARNKFKMTVEYVGDDQAGGLHCHKLKCLLVNDRQRGPSFDNFFLLWLARDRNLIAVRHQWHGLAWCEKLPTGIDYVEDLREIRPGMWFPYRSVQFAFQHWGGRGLCENRMLLQWRRDIDVTSLNLDPVVDQKLFAEVDVPAGTNIQVMDEEGELVGQFQQLKSGNVDVAPDRLAQMREQAKKTREQLEKMREQAKQAQEAKKAQKPGNPQRPAAEKK
jgi:hypothetical protein